MGLEISARLESRSKARNEVDGASTHGEVEEVLEEVGDSEGILGLLIQELTHAEVEEVLEKVGVSEDIPRTAIIVQGLVQTTSFDLLESFMSEFGEVEGAHIIRRKKSDTSVFVFAIFTMEREEDAEAAVNALQAITGWSGILVD